MNSAADHLQKARTNRDFLASLTISDSNANWGIVVLFYRALHLVRALTHQAGVDHGQSHATTNQVIQLLLPPDLSDSYHQLYTRSRRFRYDVLAATLVEYNSLERNDFQPLLVHIQGLLSGAA